MGAKQKKYGKMVFSAVFFLLVMFLTFSAFLKETNLEEVLAAVAGMNPIYLAAAAVTAVLFVVMEGAMIWYLLSAMRGKSGLLRCIGYSFIGFFFSGITPSATGGQPMQLYYMKKDGNRLSDSSVVLMTVAVVYKFVLVLIGCLILLFWHEPLGRYLGGYMPLYLLGLALNTVLVAALLFIMLKPRMADYAAHGIEQFLIRLHLLKPSRTRAEKIDGFISGYRDAVQFLTGHRGKVAVVVLGTFVQRMLVFVLTWFVYLGFHLNGTPVTTVLWLQAAIYIAVDMLPVPGAQGVTELMYKSVFSAVFTKTYLMPSMLAVRGLNFYLLLLFSLAVTGSRMVISRLGGGWKQRA